MLTSAYLLLSQRGQGQFDLSVIPVDFNQQTGQQWSLTPLLLQFMGNVIKNNESGRVIPWAAFKNILYKIYAERIAIAPHLVSSPRVSATPASFHRCSPSMSSFASTCSTAIT